MKKFWLSFMAVALISTSANAALFESDARKQKGLSCTDMCTGNIAKRVADKKFMVMKKEMTNLCDAINVCKDKCMEKGGRYTQFKGQITGTKREDKVELAIRRAADTAEGKNCPASAPSDSKTGKKPPMGGDLKGTGDAAGQKEKLVSPSK